MRTLILHILNAPEAKERVTVKGWVRTRRDAKEFSFLELNDGSCLANLQVVVDAATPGAEHLAEFLTGSSAMVEGALVPSPAQGQKWELRATKIELIGKADATYPLQKKGHTLEFLRTIARVRGTDLQQRHGPRLTRQPKARTLRFPNYFKPGSP